MGNENQVGFGATLNDRAISAIARRCPLLEKLRLTLAAVSDEGGPIVQHWGGQMAVI